MKDQNNKASHKIDWAQIITPVERLRALLARRKRTARIDWKKVHERLAQVATATEEALRLSPERGRQVMEERAQTLAHVPAEAPDAAEVIEGVSFSLANERYVIETVHIR